MSTSGSAKKHFFDAIDDPAPARVLGEQLLAYRRAGLCFEDAWIASTRTALSAVPALGKESSVRKQWALACLSTREQWRNSYERTGPPVILRLTPDLLRDREWTPDAVSEPAA